MGRDIDVVSGEGFVNSTLRILVVEDNNEKFKKVSEHIVDNFKAGRLKKPKIVRAIAYSSAILAYEGEYFDIVVLDIKIPMIDHGLPEFGGSATFLSYIEMARYRPFRIIGLSSYSPDEYNDYLKENRINVWRYDALGGEWAEYLSRDLQNLYSGKNALMTHYSNSYDLDILFMVARYENEFKPIDEAIEWLGRPVEDPRVKGFKNKFGKVRIRKGVTASLGLVCVQATGLSSTASLVGYLVASLRPRYLMMLGMCCGLNDNLSPAKKMRIGDVVVALETGCWDEGKYSEEARKEDPFYVKGRPRVPDNAFRKGVSDHLETNESELAKSLLTVSVQSFQMKAIATACDEPVTEAPAVFPGLLLSGSSVIDCASQVAVIRERFPAAIGVEMEAHAVYTAVDFSVGAKPQTLVIKGVADHGSGRKNNAAQKWASALSYTVAKNILGELYQ